MTTAPSAGTVVEGVDVCVDGNATAAPLSAPVVMEDAIPAASGLTWATALPIMIAPQSATIASDDVVR